jgi:hypothetical protein
MIKYFFAQDDSCHWYMIPVEKRELWNELNSIDTETDHWYDRWCDAGFDSYRTDGISHIEFVIPDS